LIISDEKPQSLKGYSCGARTESRFRLPPHTVTPGQNQYQPIISKPRIFKAASVPFNTSEVRNTIIVDYKVKLFIPMSKRHDFFTSSIG
jgi:hypothetical protein